MTRYLSQQSRSRLAIFIFLLAAQTAAAQTRVVLNTTTVVTDVSSAPLTDAAHPFMRPLTQIVQQNPAPSVVSTGTLPRADANGKGKCSIWLEFGDGGFTSTDSTLRQPGANSYLPFLMAVPLYDTSKGKDGTISRSMAMPGGRFPRSTSISRSGDNEIRRLNGAERIRLAAGGTGIVAGEPLPIAVTYRLPLLPGIPAEYYAVVFYNSNNIAAFSTFDPSGTMSFQYSAEPNLQLPNLRTTSSQSGLAKAFDAAGLDAGVYGGMFAVKLAPQQDSTAEFNFFATLNTSRTLRGLASGEATTIKVMLVATGSGLPNGKTVLGSHTISLKNLERAFDPNRITITPACLLLPKAENKLTGKLEFQNLGRGDADSVKVMLYRPAGLKDASFTITSVKYAGNTINFSGDDPNVYFRHSYNEANRQDIFVFAPMPGREVYLKGTSAVTDALTNPLSMGEVNYTISTTPAMADSIGWYADILFHSRSFTGTDMAHIWEEPVKTETASNVYRKRACECDNTCPDGSCYKIIGLCWWVWALILLALVILIVLLWRRRR